MKKKASSNAKSHPAGTPAAEPLFQRVSAILDQAHASVALAINSEMVLAYWHIGREIVEAIQGGEDRAEYGQQVMDGLSARLVQRYGNGFSITTLRYIRIFYQAFADRTPTLQPLVGKRPIHHSLCDESENAVQAVECQGFSSVLGWSHYRTLARVEDPQERAFYEIETERESCRSSSSNWARGLPSWHARSASPSKTPTCSWTWCSTTAS